ncbi:hypothetical protein ACYSNR_14255 [Enterococcus sp. LJL128]
MNKKYFFIIVLLLQLVGCEQNTMKTIPTDSINITNASLDTSTRESIQEIFPERKIAENEERYSELLTLPEAQVKKEISEIRKLIMIHSGYKSLYDNQDFAANLTQQTMYLYPWLIGTTEPDWELTEKDVSKIQNIIEDNNVQNWNRIYGVKPDPERTSNSEAAWTLILVFNDDTVEIHEKYYGEDSPKEYENFKKELLAFREEKREEWRKSTESD